MARLRSPPFRYLAHLCHCFCILGSNEHYTRSDVAETLALVQILKAVSTLKSVKILVKNFANRIKTSSDTSAAGRVQA